MDAFVARMVEGREAWKEYRKEYRKVRSQKNLTRLEPQTGKSRVILSCAQRTCYMSSVTYIVSSATYRVSSATVNANEAELLKRVREMKERKIFHPAITPPRERRCGRRQIRREGVRGDARRRHGNRRVVKHGAWYGRGR